MPYSINLCEKKRSLFNFTWNIESIPGIPIAGIFAGIFPLKGAEVLTGGGVFLKVHSISAANRTWLAFVLFCSMLDRNKSILREKICPIFVQLVLKYHQNYIHCKSLSLLI